MLNLLFARPAASDDVKPATGKALWAEEPTSFAVMAAGPKWPSTKMKSFDKDGKPLNAAKKAEAKPESKPEMASPERHKHQDPARRVGSEDPSIFPGISPGISAPQAGVREVLCPKPHKS